MPWIWLGLAVIFLIIEFLTSGLTTIWFALGCVPMIFLAYLPLSITWQVLIMLVISFVLLIFTRPYFVKKLKANKEKTNVEAFIGKIALVTKEITQFEKGEIKTGGIFWTAKSEDDSTIPVNTECEIIRIDGVTAIVKAIK